MGATSPPTRSTRSSRRPFPASRSKPSTAPWPCSPGSASRAGSPSPAGPPASRHASTITTTRSASAAGRSRTSMRGSRSAPRSTPRAPRGSKPRRRASRCSGCARAAPAKRGSKIVSYEIVLRATYPATITPMGQTVDLAPPPATEEMAEPVRADLCWLLSRASYIMTTKLTAALEALGVSPRAHCVLSAAMSGDHTQTELARTVGLDKTTMVVTLDELEAAGLAERRPSPHDRRARVIVVTKAGERKVREAEDIVQRIHADVLGALPARERKAFLEGLTRLVTERLSEPAVGATPVRRRTPR